MSDREKQEADDGMKQIDRAFDLLSEHFDTVQIFTSRHIGNDTGTVKWQRGGGNWFARYGQVREWMIVEEHRFTEKE